MGMIMRLKAKWQMLVGHPTPKSVGNGLMLTLTFCFLVALGRLVLMWDIFTHNVCYKNLKGMSFVHVLITKERK